jgi:hypothetical protein
MRDAPHPWGAARIAPAEPGHSRNDPGEPGWSSARPVLTRQRAAPYLACGVDGPGALPGCVEDNDAFRTIAMISRLATEATRIGFGDVGSCLFGEVIRSVQDTLSGDPIGRLYAPNIIEEWTEDVSDDATRARGERTADLYWNVSTWNPYQVVLVKTRLTTNVDGRERASTTSQPIRPEPF